MNKQIHNITPKAPYDFYRVILKLGADPLYKVNLEQQVIQIPIRVKSDQSEEGWKKVVCRLTNKGNVTQPQIEVQFEGDLLSSNEEQWIMHKLENRFQWKSDLLEQFYSAIEQDQKLSHLINDYNGLPLVLENSIYEGLIITVVHQQVNLKFAQQLVLSLAQDYGDHLTVDGEDFYYLPTPAQLSSVSVDELNQKKFSRRKAEYITTLAQRVMDNELDLAALAERSNEEFIDHLCKERGVGPWTAECILLFSLGRPNLFPAGDLAIRNAIKEIEGWSERPTIEEAKKWAQPYEQWGSYLSIYLWESLGNNRLRVKDREAK